MQVEYEQLLTVFGNEFHILRTIPIHDIQRAGFSQLARAIDNMQAGKVKKTPGYDGVFGTIQAVDFEQVRGDGEQIGLGI